MFLTIDATKLYRLVHNAERKFIYIIIVSKLSAEIRFMFEKSLKVSQIVEVLSKMPGLELAHPRLLHSYLNALYSKFRYMKKVQIRKRNIIKAKTDQ